MTTELRDILTAVREGRIDPSEAAHLLDHVPPTPPTSEPAPADGAADAAEDEPGPTPVAAAPPADESPAEARNADASTSETPPSPKPKAPSQASGERSTSAWAEATDHVDIPVRPTRTSGT